MMILKSSFLILSIVVPTFSLRGAQQVDRKESEELVSSRELYSGDYSVEYKYQKKTKDFLGWFGVTYEDTDYRWCVESEGGKYNECFPSTIGMAEIFDDDRIELIDNSQQGKTCSARTDITNKNYVGEGKCVYDSRFQAILGACAPDPFSTYICGPKYCASHVGANSILKTEALLHVDQSLYSENGLYRLLMQADGNLVIYHKDGHAVWASNTVGSGAQRLLMQADGNLVLYSDNGAHWATDTFGKGGKHAVIQNDGKLVIYPEYAGKNSCGQVWKSHN